MFNILSVILLLFSVSSLNQASVISAFDSIEKDFNFDSIQSELDLDSTENSIEFDSNEESIENFVDVDGLLYPHIDPRIHEDAKLNVPQLITKYNYNVEVHYVTTKDGYILQLHRMVGGPNSPPRKGKKPVLWSHGLMDSSAGVVISGPQHSLAYMMVDNDFDVWLVNSRGNYYSTNHTHLNPYGLISGRRYWAFSWHEIGYYDLPASIDYILKETEHKKLQFIGHSQGGTGFFVMTSMRPEYNDKIEMFHGLAPAAFLRHTKSPSIWASIPFLPILQRARELLGINFIKVSKLFRIIAGEQLCRDKVPTQVICENIVFLIMGYDSDQMNATLLPAILGHVPAGAATNQFIHYGQGVRSGHFRQYDLGPIRNLIKYKRFTPPDYELKNIRAPVAIYYAQNDWLATPRDIHILIGKLPNVVKTYLIPHRAFNHMDFLVGTEAPILLYEEILATIKSSHLYSQSRDENEIDIES